MAEFTAAASAFVLLALGRTLLRAADRRWHLLLRLAALAERLAAAAEFLLELALATGELYSGRVHPANPIIVGLMTYIDTLPLHEDPPDA